MKEILYTIMLITICSCMQKQTNNTKTNMDTKDAISRAESIKDFNNKIFMDFRFGMSTNEVNNHFQTLLDSGKITLDSDGVFKYLFKTKQGNILTSFSTQYYNGRLCEFVLNFQEIDNDIYSSPTLIAQFAQDVFHEKAMNEGYNFYIDSIGSEHVYYYIKGATIVKFSSYINPYMAYICAPLVKMKQEEHNKENKKNIQNTISDL